MNNINKALGGFGNLLGIMVNVPVVVAFAMPFIGGVISFMGPYLPWAKPVGVGVALFGVGSIVGAFWHKRRDIKRDAPMGYRVQDVTHDFRMDESDPRVYYRTYSRNVLARRSKVYLVDGRTRSDATEICYLSSTPEELLTFRNADGCSQYVAVFPQEIPRGSRAEVCIKQKFTFKDGSGPDYFHTMAFWAKSIKMSVQIPPKFVVEGSVRFCRVRGLGMGARDVRWLENHISYDPHTGLAVAQIKNPKLGFRYGIVWQWSEFYHETMVKLDGEEADMSVDNE